jgi:hypothetical protein
MKIPTGWAFVVGMAISLLLGWLNVALLDEYARAHVPPCGVIQSR